MQNFKKAMPDMAEDSAHRDRARKLRMGTRHRCDEGAEDGQGGGSVAHVAA